MTTQIVYQRLFGLCLVLGFHEEKRSGGKDFEVIEIIEIQLGMVVNNFPSTFFSMTKSKNKESLNILIIR